MKNKNNAIIPAFILAVASFIISGCDGLPFPMPGDKDALKNSCYLAQNACQKRCVDIEICLSACNDGESACVYNIDADKTTEWQPADAFYDGCRDKCSEDFCSSACSDGQAAAAVDSADRLRKYGIRTL